MAKYKKPMTGFGNKHWLLKFVSNIIQLGSYAYIYPQYPFLHRSAQSRIVILAFDKENLDAAKETKKNM